MSCGFFMRHFSRYGFVTLENFSLDNNTAFGYIQCTFILLK